MPGNGDSDGATRTITRPVVSDMDGTREGGLAFCICLIVGMIVAGTLSGAALASFWVWVALLSACVWIAANVQRVVARWNGFEDDAE